MEKLTSCELCGSPNGKKTSWNEYLCTECYNKKEKIKNNNPAGIG